MPQPARPRAPRTRPPGDVEGRVHEMRAVVDEPPAPALVPRHPPGGPPALGAGSRIGEQPVHGQLGQVPVADRALAQPVLDLPPHRVEAVLMTRHDDAAVLPRRVADAHRLGARQRDRLLAQDVIAPLQPPQGERDVGGRRRADVDEVHGPELHHLVLPLQQADPVRGLHVAGAVDQTDDLHALAHAGRLQERRQMGRAGDAARPDDHTPVAATLRRRGRRHRAGCRGCRPAPSRSTRAPNRSSSVPRTGPSRSSGRSSSPRSPTPIRKNAFRTKSTAALWNVWASPAKATSKTAPGHHQPPWISRYTRWKYRLMNRTLSPIPSSARPNRVEVPRSRASWPSAESKTSDTMNSTTPMRSVQRSR